MIQICYLDQLSSTNDRKNIVGRVYRFINLKTKKISGEKMRLLIIGLILMILLVGCTQTPSTDTKQEENKSNDSAIDSKVVEVQMTAKQWEFDPSTIEVNKGDHVKLTVESIDVKHGFNLPEFGINEELEPGKSVVIEFDATKEGEFQFICSVFCGDGHPQMKGNLIVR